MQTRVCEKRLRIVVTDGALVGIVENDRSPHQAAPGDDVGEESRIAGLADRSIRESARDGNDDELATALPLQPYGRHAIGVERTDLERRGCIGRCRAPAV